MMWIPNMTARFTLAVLALVCRCAVSYGEGVGAPEALLIGGASTPAKLQAIEADGTLRFETWSGAPSLASDALVRWGHPVDAAEARMVVLADGSQIAALEWDVGGEPLRIDDAAISFTPSSFEPLSLSRHLVRGIVLQLPVDPLQRDRLLEQVRTYTENHDAVLLAGGDRLSGRVAELKDEVLSLETSLGPVKVPLERVTAVLFESLLSGPPDEASLRLLVGLSDGSLLHADRIAGKGDRVEIMIIEEATLRGAAASNIVFLQPLGGGRVYLSDREPHRYVHVPYLDLQWPLGRDLNVLGGGLRAGGHGFAKGLGVHTAARLVYRLDGTHERFAAQAAIDDSAGRGGSAVFRVLLAEGNAWREAYTSDVIRGGDEPVPISVPLGSAKGLALAVDYADRGDELDHADWLDARLE